MKMESKIDWEEIIEEFEALTRDAGRVQTETLKKILEENGETEYLHSCGLDGRTDSDSFKAVVPIASHKDFDPYIQRIADGENSSLILTRKPITRISLNSGTTQGKPKFVPFHDELLENYLQTTMTSFAFRNREYPIENKGKALNFVYRSKQFETKGGLLAGTASTNFYHHPKFNQAMKSMQIPGCSPSEVIFGPDFEQSLYCHLLCGLISRNDVQIVSSPFAHNIVQAFRTLELVWEELVTDIRQGTLSERVTASSVRSAVAKLLKPDPELANKIYDTCLGLSKLYWYGLIQELFPNIKYIYGIMNGSMEPYVKRLRHYAGGLPLICGDYGSSEGCVGANIDPKLPPELVTFAVFPSFCYYEFIPLKQEEDSLNGLKPQPLGLTEVKIGDEYEIMLTNFSGLYRYRLGDVVKVKGFHNTTPELQFICRRNLLLNINLDKNTEKDLQISVECAAKLLAKEEKQEVIDFTCQVDSSREPGHYVIFWELSGDANNEILKKCCNCLDNSFLDAGYMTSRKSKTIGPLELRIVKSGTFREILDHYVRLGATVTQFKSPRCVGQNNTSVLQILSSNVVKSYFSTAY